MPLAWQLTTLNPSPGQNLEQCLNYLKRTDSGRNQDTMTSHSMSHIVWNWTTRNFEEWYPFNCFECLERQMREFEITNLIIFFLVQKLKVIRKNCTVTIICLFNTSYSLLWLINFYYFVQKYKEEHSLADIALTCANGKNLIVANPVVIHVIIIYGKNKWWMSWQSYTTQWSQ